MNKSILLFLISFCLIIPGCGGYQKYDDTNTSLVVHYEGREVHRRGGTNYISESQFAGMIQKKEVIIIFSADWCGACKYTKKILDKLKIKNKVYYINAEEPWGNNLMRMMQESSVPLMVHILKDGSVKAAAIGPHSIIDYLVTISLRKEDVK